MSSFRSFFVNISLFYAVLYFVFMIFLFYTPFVDSFFIQNNTQLLFEEDIHIYTDNLLNFLLGKEKLIADGFYSQNEYQHMQDVRFLFVLANHLFFLSLILLILGYRHLKIYEYLKITIISLLVVLVSGYLFFSQLFVLFHTIAFRNDLWLLPPDSSLILLFPEHFFSQFVIYICVILLLVHIFAFMIYKLKNSFTL